MNSTSYAFCIQSSADTRKRLKKQRSKFVDRTHRLIRSCLLSIAAFAIILGASFLLINQPAAEGSAPLQTILVQPGDTLWSLAADYSSGMDPREWVNETMRINHLSSSTIQAGFHLQIHAHVSN
ncbi:MAG: LysM peptidoglycan-binding protein [Bacilli bacterium]|nr:LysM peptidoglycan-binding protein [Bacilli bacterium]